MTNMEMDNVCSIGPNDQLLNAVQSNDLSLFKKLLEIGLENGSVDLDYLFDEPYHGTILDICCISTGRSEFIKVLLSLGIDVNTVNKNKKKAPIHLATANRNKDALLVLLEHTPTDVNILDSDGNSALHLAVKAEDVKCLTILLESKGIKANQLNRKGFTPACMAANLKIKNDELMLIFIRYDKHLNILITTIYLC